MLDVYADKITDEIKLVNDSILDIKDLLEETQVLEEVEETQVLEELEETQVLEEVEETQELEEIEETLINQLEINELILEQLELQTELLDEHLPVISEASVMEYSYKIVWLPLILVVIMLWWFIKQFLYKY